MNTRYAKKRKMASELNKKYAKEHPTGDPFICACQTGQLNDVSGFIEAGVVTDVNFVGKIHRGFPRYTGLMWAIQNNHIDIIKYLLSLPSINVDAGSRDVYWRKALHLAAGYCGVKENVLAILKLLLNHRTGCTADAINAQDRNRMTPLDSAFHNGACHDPELQDEIIRVIKEHGGLRYEDLPPDKRLPRRVPCPPPSRKPPPKKKKSTIKKEAPAKNNVSAKKTTSAKRKRKAPGKNKANVKKRGRKKD